MDIKVFFLYLLIMAGSTYLIRVIPFVLIKNKISNIYIKSFLNYIPYTVLASMTFPVVLYATGHIASAIVGLAVALILSFKEKSTIVVAILSSIAVLFVELIIYML